MKELKEGYRLIHIQPYGSKIYGTTVPTSDIDIKGVYIPTARDILLGKVQNNHNFKSNKTGERNSVGDIDQEYFSLSEYLKHLVGGQTVALDMLFTPPELSMMPELCTARERALQDIWKRIVDNKEKFIHSGVAAFAGYAKSQANRYGIRGSRLRTAEKAIEVINDSGYNERLDEIWDEIENFVKAWKDHSAIVTQPDANGNLMRYWEVCNRKVCETVSVKYARDVFQKVVDQYGKRAHAAAVNDGSDIKAYYHAIRVSDEAIELLTTGKITLPRPNADFLLRIRAQEFDKEYLSNLVDERLLQVEEAIEKSTLPKKPDLQFTEDLIAEVHSDIVLGKL